MTKKYSQLEPGTKVVGLKYEFKGVEGVVLKHHNDSVVIVKFEGTPIHVVTTRDNLKEI